MSKQLYQGINIGDYLEIASKNTVYVRILISIIIVTLLLFILFYVNNKLTYVKRNCKVINKNYENFGLVKSINLNDSSFKGYSLRDYYIKTAYNCCAIGDFKNGFVDNCALKKVIKQGVRCLDFEIYSLNDKPIIAVSSKKNIHYKESYNYLDFSRVMKIIDNYAFSNTNCPNANDPLILNFRIMSKNKIMIKKMANIIYETLSSRMLGKDYSYEYYGDRFSNITMDKILNKVIIMCDRSNDSWEDTPLYEYVNIATNSNYMRILKDYDVKYCPDMDELIEFNKLNITFSTPDLTGTNYNISHSLHRQFGIQMIGMCYQNYDEKLKYYEQYFSDTGYAFVLKPDNLRYVEITIDAPPPADPKLSYETKEVKGDFYEFKI